MANKIIPLKKSPLKYEEWEYMANQLTDPLDLMGYRKGEEDKNRIAGIEGDYDTLKQGLIDIDVTKNFYADLANPYAGLEDPFASLEDTSEDLTTNVKAREQEERLLQRGLSQTLQQTKQTGTQNTQAIANQLAQSSGDIAAKTGAEEYELGKLKARSKQDLGLKKAGSKRETDMMVRKGAFDTKMQQIKGSEDAMSRELNKQQALLGLTSGELARADQAAEDQLLGGILSW